MSLLPRKFGRQRLIFSTKIGSLQVWVGYAKPSQAIGVRNADGLPHGHTGPERVLAGLGDIAIHVNRALFGHCDDGILRHYQVGDFSSFAGRLPINLVRKIACDFRTCGREGKTTAFDLTDQRHADLAVHSNQRAFF